MTKSKWKNILYTFALIIAMAFVWWLRESRDNLKEWDKVELTGATMGTSYQVKYLVSESISYQTSIDSLLEDINLCLSTYIPESEISRFNKSTLHKFERPYFYEMLIKSRSIYQKTIGAFDPTVMPLVVAWGFGPVESELPNQDEVDYLLTKAGFEKIFFEEYASWCHYGKQNHQKYRPSPTLIIASDKGHQGKCRRHFMQYDTSQ